MSDPRTIAVYQAKAQEYAKRFTHAEPDGHFLQFAERLAPASRVLDLGCGHGPATQALSARGHDVLGLDASAALLEIARKGSDATFHLGTFDDILTLGNFDAVWANFSLLHAARPDLPRHLRDICHALNDGGLLHIGMKTGTGTARDGIDRRYTYVTADELSGLLDAAGFEVLACEEGAGAGLDGTVAPWVVILSAKRC